MAPPVLLMHPSSLLHDMGPHPEQPLRITAIDRALAAEGDLGCERVESPAATREQLLRVHSEAHIARIEAIDARGGGMIDGDTAMNAHSLTAALHGAGGAVALVDGLCTGAFQTGWSLHRPPGHHAEPERAMGFCLFGSIAVAAAHARAVHGVERVLVLDWDVHHGNGTEAAFIDDPGVLFVSIHESPLYPGTGPVTEIGRGAGEGFTINLPVPARSGDATYASLVEHLVLPIAQAYAPGLILVSAGFDAHRADPLAGCEVTEAGFAAMTGSLRRLAADLDVPIGMVLEGGYDVDALASSVVAVTRVLVDVGVPAADPALAVAGRTRALAGVLGAWWPVVEGLSG